MKFFDTKKDIQEIVSGEFIIGLELTGSHACYMIYGVMKPLEKDRLIKPGKGHEEIVLILKGSVNVTGHWEGTLKEGDSFHITGEETLYFENPFDSEVVYVIAGGHSEEGHHH